MTSRKAITSVRSRPDGKPTDSVAATGRTGLCRFVLLVSMAAWVAGLGVPAGGLCAEVSPSDAPRSVLLLNSYNKGFPWSDNIVQAVESSFAAAPERVDLWIEYMDTKRFPDSAYPDRLYPLYRHKFRSQRFDAVITSDNAAFQFALRYRRDLFGEAPLVFCGINRFDPAMIAGQPDITGIVERADFESTIRLAPRLWPAAREIVVVIPTALSPGEDRKTIEGLMPSLGPALTVTFWQGVDLEEALQRAASLRRESVILSSDVIQTRTGQVISNLDKIRELAAVSPTPVFVVREEDLGTGALGGRLLSGSAHGRKAADFVLRILRGAKASDIPVLSDEANPHMFDFAVMERFGISPAALPDGSQLINQPETRYQRYRAFMWAAGIAVVVLMLFAGALIVTILGRRAAERALRESEERLRALIENSPMAIYLKDLQGRYLIANEEYRRRFDLTPTMVIGKTADEVLPPDNAKDAISTDGTVFSTKAPYHREEEIRYSDGSLHSHVFTKFPTFDSRGGVNGVGFISIDVTDAKNTANAARELQHELAYVSRLSTMGEMAAGFAHELNQPLTAIGNFATGCIRRLERPECHSQTLMPALVEIAKQAQRAGDIIRHIRGFVGKKDDERGDGLRPEIDINAAIRAAAGLVGNEALRHGANLRLKLAPVLPPIQADTIQVQQIVVNLARNAMEAMDDAGSETRDLTIQTATTAEGGAEIRVMDTGPGIPDDLQRRMFEPFFTTKAAGMGMGLSICRSIAEAHGGTLSAANRGRGGAEFRLVLPPALREPNAAE